jgi:alkylation response protein AidB-like acyl-CoA dehydrogenase
MSKKSGGNKPKKERRNQMPELNAEQKALQKAFREFAQKEIKPIAMERDKIDDPAEAFPVDLFKKSFELDLHTSCIPEKYGGMGLDALSHVVIWEELAAADAGFCVSYEGHVTALAFVLVGTSIWFRARVMLIVRPAAAIWRPVSALARWTHR